METALYLPVKRFLENLGFTVKGEIGSCDLVALSGDEPPVVVIGELKLAFNLELILQAVDRAGSGDEVWIAARMSARGKGRESDARYRNLCRRLGFGMLAVTSGGAVDRLQDQFKIKGKLQFPDHNDRGIVAAQRHEVATADFALDREAELFEEAFDGQIKRGFQGGSSVVGATQRPESSLNPQRRI